MDQVRSIRYTILLVILVVLTAYTYLLRFRPVEDPELPVFHNVPKIVGDYIGTDEQIEPEFLTILGADATMFRSYRNGDGRAVWLFIGYFKSQQENSQIHSPKHCYPGAGWNLAKEDDAALLIGDDTISSKHLVLSNGEEKQIVLYWFSTYSGVINDEFALKWHQMKNSLLRKPQSAAFIRFSAMVNVGDAEDATREDLVKFAESITPSIKKILQ